MTHELLLPIAGCIVNPWLIISIGFLGGLLTGLLGVGGGLFITPTLMTLGIPPVTAVASQVNSMIGVSFIGYLTYKKNNDVDYPLAGIIIVGGFLGSMLGIYFIGLFAKTQVIKYFITYAYFIILGIMAVLLFRQSKRNLRQHLPNSPQTKPMSPKWITKPPYVHYFARSRLTISLVILFGAGLINGWLISVLGIGNGVFMMPALIYLIGRTSPVTYGTTLLTTVVITIISTCAHALQSDSVDIVLVLLLLAGGLFGSQLGVLLSYKIPRVYLGFAGCGVMILILLQTAFKYFFPNLLPALIRYSSVDPDNTWLIWIKELEATAPLTYAISGILLAIVLSLVVQGLKELPNRLNLKKQN